MDMTKPKTFSSLFKFASIGSLAFVVWLGCSQFADAQTGRNNLNEVRDSTNQDLLPSERPVEIRPQGERFQNPETPSREDRLNTSDQPILLNAKYAGWQGATIEPATNGKRISTNLRSNWIMVDQNGRVSGQVKPAGDANIEGMAVFLMHMGRLVKQTRVDDQGMFEFTNVRQGGYALIGWGANGFFAFGMNILAHNPESFGRVGNTLDILAYQNKTTINTDWIQYFASRVSFRVFGRYPTGEGRDDPSSLYGVRGLYNNLPDSFPATSINSHTVTRTSDDRLVGRVHQMNSFNGRPVDVRTTQVILLEGDSVVASTTTDNYGTFEFRSVPNGTYGVLAAGVDGVGMITVNVSDSLSAIDAAGEAAGASDSGTINFTMVSAETIGWLNHRAREIAYQRGLRRPRPQYMDGSNMCPTCNNQPGGCAQCQQNGINCRSKDLTFEQWLANGCQSQRQGFGDGYFLRETGKRLRRNIERIDEFYDRAFYPNESEAGGYGNYGAGYNGYGTGYNGYGAGYNGYGN